MSHADINDTLLDFCGGDTEALDFINHFWQLCVVWDDTIDRDKPLDEKAVNDAFLWAIFGLHEHPFYRKYGNILRPVMMKCAGDWIVANRFEHSGDEHKVTQAYFMRCAPYDVFAMVVILASGFNKMVEAVDFLRSLAAEDSLGKYVLEHWPDSQE